MHFGAATNAEKIIFNDKTQTLGNVIFDNCKNLKCIVVGKNVNNISPQFALYRDISMTIDEANSNFVVENQVLYNKDKTKIVAMLYRINGVFEVKDTVKCIGTCAFYFQGNMTEINLSKVEKLESMIFYGCSKLKTLTIPSTIQEIDESAFENTTGLNNIVIHRKENAIPGSPFGSPFGLRGITWDGTN